MFAAFCRTAVRKERTAVEGDPYSSIWARTHTRLRSYLVFD